MLLDGLKEHRIDISSRDRIPDVSVLTSGHDVADARLHREVAALARAGLRVEVLGLGSAADAPPGAAAVRTWPRPGLAGRATLAARMAGVAAGRVLFTLDPDSALAGYVATRTPRPGVRPGRRQGGGAGRYGGRRQGGGAGLGGGPPEGRAHRRKPLVVDVHEDYARLLADRAWTSRVGGAAGVMAKALVAAFLGVAARADLTVVADQHVPPLTARRRLVVRNLPDLAMLPQPGPRQGSPRALYVGDVRSSRGLFAMLAALRAAPAWSLDVVGPVAGADRQALDAALAADPGLAARVRWHGRMPPAAAFALADGAWTGLLLLADTPAFVDALPSKLHEYLACGLAVITTDLPRQAELVRASGAGVVVPGWGGTGSEVSVGAQTVGAETVGVGTVGAQTIGAGTVGVGTVGAQTIGAGTVGAETVGAAVGAVLNRWAADPGELDALRAAAATHARQARRQAGGYDELASAVAELARGEHR